MREVLSDVEQEVSERQKLYHAGRPAVTAKPTQSPSFDGAAGSAEQRWRQLTRPIWIKHRRAGRHMMRWLHVPGRKPKLRHKKWARQYERTLDRIPMPPEDDPPNSGMNDSQSH